MSRPKLTHSSYFPAKRQHGAGSNILGVILAGGKSKRMVGAGPKCLTDLGGKTILRRVIDRAAGQCNGLILNVNEDLDLFEGYGLPIVKDTLGDQPGPLAGILTAMEWAKDNAENQTVIASFASDSPFFPETLVQQLGTEAAGSGKPIICASSKGKDHFTFGLWPVELAGDLRKAMIEDGVRKVGDWARSVGLAKKVFSAPGGVDPFFNINEPEDMVVAQKLLKKVK